jgi:hypothetical protein
MFKKILNKNNNLEKADPEPAIDKNNVFETFTEKRLRFRENMHGMLRVIYDHGMAKHEYDATFFKEWDEKAESITATERAELFLDFAKWHALRAEENSIEASLTQILYEKNYLFLGSLRLPNSLLDSKVFCKPMHFNEQQAKEVLHLLCEASLDSKNHLQANRPKYLSKALMEAIVSPDEALASRVRNCLPNRDWTKPLLQKLCPVDNARSAAASDTGVQRKTKAGQRLDESLADLQSTLQRLPRMWVELPQAFSQYWRSLNHQLFPYSSELLTYFTALEEAALCGDIIEEDKNCASDLIKVAQTNLNSLKLGQGNLRSLDDIIRYFPKNENLRTGNIYWSRPEREEERDVFLKNQQPNIDLIIKVESKYLASLEERLIRITSIEPKKGVSAKMQDLYPNHKASKPTKSWIKKAQTLLTKSDLDEVVAQLADSDIPDCMGALYDPELGNEVYERLCLEEKELHASVWAAHLAGKPAAEPLYIFAKKCYEKVSWRGPRSQKLGNAAAVSLSLIEGDGGISYLMRLHKDTNYPKIKKTLDGLIEEVAKENSVSVQELEEKSAIDHGFA